MGAAEWVSRVPYQPDIAAALQVARWDAFRAGGHSRDPEPDPGLRSMTEDEYVAWCEAEHGPDFGGEVARMEWRAAQVDPVDPDSLLASRPFDGTGTVIDMTGVAATPESGRVAPVTGEMLDAMFLTRTPSTQQVEAMLPNLDLYGRGHGTYIIGYRDGSPDTIFFVGHSGD